MASGPTHVQLGHGAGGLMTHRLVTELFVPALGNEVLSPLDDAARLPGGLCLTTDAFVVDPLFFPGGDIGSLAVAGTVNDLAVSGALPIALCAAFILEEGLPMEDLRRIAASMARTAEAAGVRVVAGDTKVVPRGKGDGCFITTAGVGRTLPGLELGADRGQPGDLILVSGPVGQHGAAILARRAGLEPEGAVASDCAPLWPLLREVFAEPEGLHTLRDPTRGGLGTALSELASSAGLTVEIDEAAIPLSPPVRTTCELLGLDPLFLACEGRAVIFAAPEAAARTLAILQGTPAGREAAIIGRLLEGPARVILRTAVGGRRLVTMLASDPLPRIC